MPTHRTNDPDSPFFESDHGIDQTFRAQRDCSMANCHRLDVQPGKVWEDGEYHDVWYCPRHALVMTDRFTPTPPDIESLREANAQVRCYCTRNTSGHRHRPERGCPTTPLPGSEYTARDAQDDALLADLFIRAVRDGLLTLDLAFRPGYALRLKVGVQHNRVDVTDAQMAAIKRRFVPEGKSR